jgi:hypothetical protein
LMGEKGASVQTPEWSTLIEKVLIQSRDSPVLGKACAIRSHLTQLLAKQPLRCYRNKKADPPSISLRINHIPHGPWFFSPQCEIRGPSIRNHKTGSFFERDELRWEQHNLCFRAIFMPGSGCDCTLLLRGSNGDQN